jgi:hypothetical protein
MLKTVGSIIAKLRLGPGRSKAARKQERSRALQAPEGGVSPQLPPLERTPRVVVCGKVRKLGALFERLPVPGVVESVNEVLLLARARVQAAGGAFEFHSGSEFNAIFENPVTALEAALGMRADLARLNQERGVDGLPELYLAVGAHFASVVRAFFGPAELRQEAVVGPAFSVSRALSELAERSGVDLLVSQSLGEAIEGKFCSVRFGEFRSEAAGSLIEASWIEGYFEESGKLVPLVTPESREAQFGGAVQYGAPRWLVNNGSQILGPWTAAEIAGRLFSQELDFDCECWTEGTGISSRIAQAGIFGAVPEGPAEYWLYDGTTVHGPLAKDFLLSAWSRGAVASDSFVCLRSTVAGWEKLSDWVESQKSRREAA